jgi:hypothetical protein
LAYGQVNQVEQADVGADDYVFFLYGGVAFLFAD